MTRHGTCPPPRVSCPPPRVRLHASFHHTAPEANHFRISSTLFHNLSNSSRRGFDTYSIGTTRYYERFRSLEQVGVNLPTGALRPPCALALIWKQANLLGVNGGAVLLRVSVLVLFDVTRHHFPTVPYFFLHSFAVLDVQDLGAVACVSKTWVCTGFCSEALLWQPRGRMDYLH